MIPKECIQLWAKMSTLKYIRKHYRVDARRGVRVRFGKITAQICGTIVGADRGQLRVQFDGHNYSSLVHPRRKLAYLPKA